MRLGAETDNKMKTYQEPSMQMRNKYMNRSIEVGLMLLVGMNWNSHALGTKN